MGLISLCRVSGREREVRRGQMAEGFAGLKKTGFYFKWNGEPLQGAKQRNDTFTHALERSL